MPLGVVENITYTNIHLYDVPRAVFFTMNFSKHYIPPTNETATPKFVNINLDHLFVNNSLEGYFLDGLNESVITGTYLADIQMNNTLLLEAQCQYVTGFCDNSTVLPSCPSCVNQPPCQDQSSDCSQYLGQCGNPTYRKGLFFTYTFFLDTMLCNLCRKTCNLCDSCNNS